MTDLRTKGIDSSSGLSDEEEYYEEEEEEEEISWIAWFCSQKGNELFCEVEEEYIEDDFNLTSLSTQVPFYRQALNTILDLEPIGNVSPEQTQRTAIAAEMLYGLIHARYILSSTGLHQCAEKFRRHEYGCCPRVYCNKQAAIPVGLSDIPDTDTVKMFCPACQDIFTPRSPRHARIDGSYFGTTFPHLLFHTYPHLVPPRSTKQYVPRIFGFKIRRPTDLVRSVGVQVTSPAGPVVVDATRIQSPPTPALSHNARTTTVTGIDTAAANRQRGREKSRSGRKK